MYTVIQSQDPFSGLITLDEAKRQCRLLPSFTMDDVDLTHIIEVACSLAQTYTRRLLTEGVVQMESNRYQSSVILPKAPVTIINEVLLDDVEDTDYTFSTTTGILKPSRTYSNIKVNYDAGYSVLPTSGKHGILLLISTMYDNREDFMTGATVSEIPLKSTVLLDSIKDYHV